MCKTDWNMVGALGQWVGAIFTGGAVILALRQNRINIIVSSDIKMKIRNTVQKDVVNVRIANMNDGYIQINEIGINQIGMLNVEYNKKLLPKILAPGEVFICEINIREHNIWGVMTVYVVDCFGKRHVQKTKLMHKVSNSFILRHPRLFKYLD